MEGYLRYRGDNFVKRFDANSYLYITKAMDRFDLLSSKKLSEVFRGVKAKVLIIAFKSDWLYPTYQSQEISRPASSAGSTPRSVEINSTTGTTPSSSRWRRRRISSSTSSAECQREQ